MTKQRDSIDHDSLEIKWQNQTFVSKNGKTRLCKKPLILKNGDITATFEINNESFNDKVRDLHASIISELEISNLVGDLKLRYAKNPESLPEIIELVRKKITIEGPQKPILEAIIKDEPLIDKYYAELSIMSCDPNNYYLKINNNLVADDMRELTVVVRKFLKTTQNAITRVSGNLNTNTDIIIRKLIAEKESYSEIAKKLPYAANGDYVKQRVLRMKQNSVKYKKT